MIYYKPIQFNTKANLFNLKPIQFNSLPIMFNDEANNDCNFIHFIINHELYLNPDSNHQNVVNLLQVSTPVFYRVIKNFFLFVHRFILNRN